MQGITGVIEQHLRELYERDARNEYPEDGLEDLRAEYVEKELKNVAERIYWYVKGKDDEDNPEPATPW